MNPTDKPTDQNQMPGQAPSVPLTPVQETPAPTGEATPTVNPSPAPQPAAPVEEPKPAAPVVPDPNNPGGATTPPTTPGV